jgi:hypothetical protein
VVSSVSKDGLDCSGHQLHNWSSQLVHQPRLGLTLRFELEQLKLAHQIPPFEKIALPTEYSQPQAEESPRGDLQAPRELQR